MKSFVSFIFLLLLSTNITAQSWYAMGDGFTVGTPCITQSICSYQGNIIANGYFKKAGTASVNAIAQWNGNQWQAMGLGLWWSNSAYIPSGEKIIVYHNKLITTGGFEGAGGIFIGDTQHYANGTATWDGTDWYPLTPGPLPAGVNSACYGLYEYHNNLYFGGHFGNAFDSSGSIVSRGIAKWNDTVFSAVGQFAGNFPPYGYYAALTFTEYNNKLIAGGFFTSIDGSPYGSYSGIAAWNDTAWSALGTGFNDYVSALTVFNGELYAGGKFTATGDNLTPLNHIAKWNGNSWQQVGTGLNDTVFALCVDSVHNKLVAGGKFTQTGNGQPAKYIATWDGTSWQELGGGTNAYVSTLYSKDSNLYVGGNFTQVGNTPANRIAVWGNNPVGINEINKNENGITVYPNPVKDKLIVNSEKITGYYSLIISNVLGQIVIVSQFEGGRGMIDVSQLPHGVYFVNVNGEYTKIVKE